MSFMQENKLLDSNILVYAFDKNEKQKHEIAKALLDRCLGKQENFFISIQNISEFYNVVTQNIEKPLSKTEAREICQEIIQFNGFVKLVPTVTTLLEAMKLNETYGIHYWDAILASIMRENAINSIYTENVDDFKKIPGLKIINPF